MKEIRDKNDLDHMTEANMVEGLMEKVTWEEIVIAVKAIKPGKTAGSSEGRAEMI